MSETCQQVGQNQDKFSQNPAKMIPLLKSQLDMFLSLVPRISERGKLRYKPQHHRKTTVVTSPGMRSVYVKRRLYKQYHDVLIPLLPWQSCFIESII